MGKNLALALTTSFLFVACAHSPAPIGSRDQESRVSAPSRHEAMEVVPGSRPGPIARNWQKYKGRKKYVRNGHCVMLVLDAVPRLGNTVHWARGEHVYQNTSLEPGTPIATFDDSGVYGNRRGGTSHAALYIGQTDLGIYVLDQWRPTRKSRGQRPKQRFIPWEGRPNGAPANSGLAYYVINRLNSGEYGHVED